MRVKEWSSEGVLLLHGLAGRSSDTVGLGTWEKEGYWGVGKGIIGSLGASAS